MVNHWYLWLPFSLTSMIDKNRQIQTIDMLLSVKNKINLKKFQYKKKYFKYTRSGLTLIRPSKSLIYINKQ